MQLTRRVLLTGAMSVVALKGARASTTFEVRIGVVEPQGSALKLKCKMVQGQETVEIFNEVYQGYLKGQNGIVRAMRPVRLLLKVHDAKGVSKGDKIPFRINDVEELHEATGTGFIPVACSSLPGKLQVVAVPRSIIDGRTYVQVHAPDEDLVWPCTFWDIKPGVMHKYDFVRPILVRKV